MSFDLYFCSRQARELDFGEVVGWSGRYSAFKRSAETQLFYENGDTGVYFSLDYLPPADRTGLEIPVDVLLVGLSFNLNFLRPNFFATEAMPIVESLTQEFNLMIFDPQANNGARALSSAQLVDSWSEHNRWAVAAAFNEDVEFFYLPHDKAAGFWGYMRDYPNLAKELESDDVFVPRQFLLAPNNSLQAGTAIVWTQGIHLLVPRTDWIYVVYPKSFRRRENKVVCFSSETVLTPMSQYLRPHDASRGLRILPRENLDRADKVLTTLSGGLDPGDFSRLAPDKCVDVPFGQFAPV